jgi:hypothetical protein
MWSHFKSNNVEISLLKVIVQLDHYAVLFAIESKPYT